MEDRWGWIAAAVAAIPAAWAAWLNRRGAKEQREGDWREKGNQALFDQQSAQLKAAYGRIAELEAERAQERAEFRVLEADRDEGWDVGRGWERKAHELCHRLNNLAMRLPEKDRPEPLDLPRFRDIRRVEAPKP